jgi:hypothetical protein
MFCVFGESVISVRFELPDTPPLELSLTREEYARSLKSAVMYNSPRDNPVQHVINWTLEHMLGFEFSMVDKLRWKEQFITHLDGWWIASLDELCKPLA